MSVYEFEHGASGERVERDFPIGRAPRSVRVNGRVFVRVPSVPMAAVFVGRVSGRDVSFVSSALGPQHLPYHKGQFVKDRHGTVEAAFRNRAEADDLCKRWNDDHPEQPIHYDGDALRDARKRQRRAGAGGPARSSRRPRA